MGVAEDRQATIEDRLTALEFDEGGSIVPFEFELINGWEPMACGIRMYRQGRVLYGDGGINGDNADDPLCISFDPEWAPPGDLPYGGGWFKVLTIKTDGTIFASGAQAGDVYLTGIQWLPGSVLLD